MKQLIEILKYLEENFDYQHIEDTTSKTMRALEGKSNGNLPIINTTGHVNFKPFSMQDTHDDMRKMMYNELIPLVLGIKNKDDSIPMIRSNYGVGTLPSLFGYKSNIEGNNMPWIEHAKDLDSIKKIIDSGVPNLDIGLGKKIIETYEFYNETLLKYPNCLRCIKLYHPDYQGPFDLAHLIWGSDIYYAVYDEPELVHNLLSLVTATYIKKMQQTKKYLNDEVKDYNYHWKTLYGGKITLRNDSAVNLSKDMYMEFVKPYDEKILKEFGCGSMHFCGRADQIVFEMMKSKNLKGLNFGHMDNVQFGEPYLDFIYPELTKNNLALYGYTVTTTEFELLDKVKYGNGISYIIKS